MKKLQLLLVFIPFITFSQSKKNASAKPPLLESITSDTAKGMFNQVLFSYDERSRVVSITYKDLKIIKDSVNAAKLVETITKTQAFEYQGNSIQPYLRTNHYYGYIKESDKWILGSIEKTYFLYKLTQRIGDSSLLVDNDDEKQDFKWDDNKASTTVSKLEQTNDRIYQKDDFTNPSTGYPNIYTSEFKLMPFKNINYELYEHRYGNRSRDGKYSTFTKFDLKLNPLKQLNISNALCNEKVSFYLTEENGSIDDPYEVKVINWYFFNQNNILDYFVTFDEITSHYKDIVNLRYTYNQYNQPVYVKVVIKKVSHDATPKQMNVYAKYTKKFTFKYKK